MTTPKKVFVVGVGMTRFTRPGASDRDYPELVLNAVTKALLDAGVNYDSVQFAAVGYVYADSTAGQRALYQLGLTQIPIVNVNNSEGIRS
ncbi:tyrosine protein phosphatase [Entophlyctis luteolus]|nr:tyrosine protein phosphatase [Entophlyctis luteolus]